MAEHLFVYGTLMRGSLHPMARALAAHAAYLGEARYNGRLYLVKRYPGAVASAESGDTVLGEVFALRDPRVLLALDDYEGCGPEAEEPAEYRRLIQNVTLSGGTGIEAWVYVYNWPVTKLQRIVSGRFEATGP